jgi:hypothetical protein
LSSACVPKQNYGAQRINRTFEVGVAARNKLDPKKGKMV